MNLLDAFQDGQSTLDVRRTKVRAIYALIAAPSALSLYAAIKVFWPDFPLSVEGVGVVVAWVMGGVGVVSHIISTKRLGVQRAPLNYQAPQGETKDRTYS